jgi:hypothetical protein
VRSIVSAAPSLKLWISSAVVSFSNIGGSSSRR